MNDKLIQPILAASDAPPPASEAAITQLHAELGFELPEDYLAFIRQCNGYDGNEDPLNMRLDAVEHLIEVTTSYEVDVARDQLLYFGSNWADTAYAFDFRYDMIQIVETPYGGAYPSDYVYYGETFEDFLTHRANGTHAKQPRGLKKRPIKRKKLKATGDKHQPGLYKKLRAHANAVISLDFSRDGRLALSHGWKVPLIIWDTESWKKVFVPDDTNWPALEQWYVGIRGMAAPVRFMPDGKSVVFRSFNDAPNERCRMTVFNFETGDHDLRFQSDELAFPTQLHFSPDGKWLLSEHPHPCHDAQLTNGLWNVATGELVRMHQGLYSCRHSPAAFTCDGSAYALFTEITRNGERALGEYLFQQYETASGELLAEHTCKLMEPWPFFYTPDGTMYALTGGYRLMDVVTDKWPEVIDSREDFRALQPAGADRLICGTPNGALRLLNLKDGKQLWSTEGDRGTHDVIAVHPEQRWAVSGGEKNGSVYVWHLP